MRSLAILLTAFIFWTTRGLALRCMNCTSSSVATVKGCHGDFSPQHMVECPNSSYCQVSRYRGAYEGVGIIQYSRICADEFREECFMQSDMVYDGVTCVYSCQDDGCNSMNIFPNEPEYITPTPPVIPTTTTRTIAETERPLLCYNCTSDPEDPFGDCDATMSDESLIACHPEEKYCLVSKVMDADIYSRTCSYILLNECGDYDYDGMVCHRTCTTDGCNDFTEFGEVTEEESNTTTRQPRTTEAEAISSTTKDSTPSSSGSNHGNIFAIIVAGACILAVKEIQVR